MFCHVAGTKSQFVRGQPGVYYVVKNLILLRLVIDVVSLLLNVFTIVSGKSKKDSKSKSTSCSDQTNELDDLLSRINSMDLEAKTTVACSDERSAPRTDDIEKPSASKLTKEILKRNISNDNVDRCSERMGSRERGLVHVSSKDQCNASGHDYFSLNSPKFPDGLENVDNKLIASDGCECDKLNSHVSNNVCSTKASSSMLESIANVGVHTNMDLLSLCPGSTLSPALNVTNKSRNLVDITFDQSFNSELPNIDDFLASSFVAHLDVSHADISSPARMFSRISTPHVGKSPRRSYQFDKGDLIDSLDELFSNSEAELEEEAVVGLEDRSQKTNEINLNSTSICSPQEEASLTTRLLQRFRSQQHIETLRLISSDDDNNGAKVCNSKIKVTNKAIESQ